MSAASTASAAPRATTASSSSSTVGEELRRDKLLRQLVDIQYERNDVDFHRGTFRVRGDVVEIFPAYEQETAIRIEFFGDDIEAIKEVDPLRGQVKRSLDRYAIYPGSHYVTPQAQMRRAIESIREELRERLDVLDKEGRFLEKQRLEQRTLYDLEMMEQMGFCSGIENYSRHLSGRKPGEPPPTLIDYFPTDFLLVIDESHQTVPQLRRCTAATARARRRSSSTASACRARSTTGRSSSTSSRSTCARSSTCRRRRASTSSRRRRASSSSSSSARPG